MKDDNNLNLRINTRKKGLIGEQMRTPIKSAKFVFQRRLINKQAVPIIERYTQNSKKPP